MSRPLALLLDFGGTLDADGVPWAPRFHAAYRAAGGATDFATFEPVFRATDRALAGAPGIRAMGFAAMLELQARMVCERLPDGARIAPARVAAAFHLEAVRTVERNRPVLERLSADYRLGVVSNFTGNLEPCLVELGLRPYFGVVTDSAVVGAEKPDPVVFTRTLAALDTSPTAAWMVGDNFNADIRPALALGMGACWLTPLDRAAPTGGEAAIRLARLPDLEPVLRSCTD